MDSLSTEARNLETEYRAALTLEEPEPDPTETPSEDRELAKIRERVEFREYAEAALAGHGVVKGAAAELNQALGIADEYIPMEMLAEERAAVAGDAGASQGTWVDRVFHESAAQRIGVTFPNVAPGIANFPVTMGGGSGAQRERAEAAAIGTYTLSVKELKPTRNAVHGVFSLEDNYRVPGFFEAMIRDMRGGMVETIDKVVFAGDATGGGTEADIVGFNGAAIAESELMQANKVKGPETLAVFAAFIDGQYAASPADLRVVAFEGANILWMSTAFNLTNGPVDTIAQYLRANGVNYSVKGDIETATTNNKLGAVIGLGRGIEGAAVAPVWDAAQLVRDPFSNSEKGEVKLTLNYFWNFAIARAANYKRLKFVSN